MDTSRLPHVVPGVYLARVGDLTLEEVRNELRDSGLLFARRFLAHTTTTFRSDYLLVFDQKILVNNCRLEHESSLPLSSNSKKTTAMPSEESWAGRVIKATEPTAMPSLQDSSSSLNKQLTTVVVAAASAKLPSPSPPLPEADLFRPPHEDGDHREMHHHPESKKKKKIRPGRRARQMLKDLIAASASTEKPQQVSCPPPLLPSPPPMVVKSEEIPLGATLLVQRRRQTDPSFVLRPFRVSGESNRPHNDNLIVYHPPVPKKTEAVGGDSRTALLANADKSHSWIKQVIETLVVCGVLQDVSACQVQRADLDAGRLSRLNLTSLRCHFREDVPDQSRNAVYAILRSSMWFYSLIKDPSPSEERLVRCWWWNRV